MTVSATTHHAVRPAAFRSALSQVASAVSVVTTLHGEVPHGTTVSAFTSLSLEPAMVLAALDQRSDLLARLAVGSTVGINVLAAHQDQIALRFARKGADKFDGIAWRTEDGAPALVDRHGWIAGTVNRLIEAGDHVIVLVDVQHAAAGEHAPLTYWQRTFGTHQGF